jgi:hypothetical protein
VLLLNKLVAGQTLDLDLGFLADPFSRAAADGTGASSPSLSRHGGEGTKLIVFVFVWVMFLQHGSNEADPGSVPTTALSKLLFKLVDSRPLPPSSPVTTLSGRRLQVYYNLQAMMPYRRPFPSGVEGSWCPTSSGLVPSGEVLLYAASRSSGGNGAGPDCFVLEFCGVLCVNCVDFVVILYFLVVPPITVPPSNESF